MLTQHNQKTAQMSPDPFLLRGRGLGTRLHAYTVAEFFLHVTNPPMQNNEDQEIAQLSPDPFPLEGGVWGRD